MTVVTENRTCWLTAESRRRLTVKKGACAIICHDFQNSFKRRATAGLPATSDFEQWLIFIDAFCCCSPNNDNNNKTITKQNNQISGPQQHFWGKGISSL
jgi:hypothetical protein